jgi:hypothetical protein
MEEEADGEDDVVEGYQRARAAVDVVVGIVDIVMYQNQGYQYIDSPG